MKQFCNFWFIEKNVWQLDVSKNDCPAKAKVKIISKWISNNHRFSFTSKIRSPSYELVPLKIMRSARFLMKLFGYYSVLGCLYMKLFGNYSVSVAFLWIFLVNYSVSGWHLTYEQNFKRRNYPVSVCLRMKIFIFLIGKIRMPLIIYK